MAELGIDSISVRFGGNVVLTDVDITFEAGRVTGLIGPNGAGKTTLFNVVTGLLPPGSGQVLLDGNDITKHPPHKRARLGIARTFQRLELFMSLSVRDNVRVAGEIRNSWGLRGRADRRGRGPSGRPAEPARAEIAGGRDPAARGSSLQALAEHNDSAGDAERIMKLVGLSEVADREVSEIPTGQARLVELARALMVRPSVLLLDEPASGQTETETVAFGALLRRLATDVGLTVCLVEHDMSLVMNVCERIHVLHQGRVIATGTPAQIRQDPAVIDAYLGPPQSAA